MGHSPGGERSAYGLSEEEVSMVCVGIVEGMVRSALSSSSSQAQPRPEDVDETPGDADGANVGGIVHGIVSNMVVEVAAGLRGEVDEDWGEEDDGFDVGGGEDGEQAMALLPPMQRGEASTPARRERPERPEIIYLGESEGNDEEQEQEEDVEVPVLPHGPPSGLVQAPADAPAAAVEPAGEDNVASAGQGSPRHVERDDGAHRKKVYSPLLLTF
jgi:hypothetical protein